MCECGRLTADNTKLTNEIKKLSNNVCALSANRNKFASELEDLCRDKANTSSNNLVLVDSSSPCNGDVVLPCLKQPFRYFMQMLRRRKVMTRMQMKMMLTNMTVTLILKVMATKVLRIKTFAIGKISNQMNS